MRFGRIMLPSLLLTVGTFVSLSQAQSTPASTEAVQITGLTGVKNNTKGNLKVENGSLSFASPRNACSVSATSIQDVVTGNDSQRVIGGTVGSLTMLAPYGAGRAISLLRSKIDTLTIQYRDPNGGLHGVIFTLPLGKAELIKADLLAQGAHTSISPEGDSTVGSLPQSAAEEKKR